MPIRTRMLPEEEQDVCPYCGWTRKEDNGHGKPRCPRQGCPGQNSGYNLPPVRPTKTS